MKRQLMTGNAAAGKIDGAKAGALGEQRAIGVDGAGDLQWPFRIQGKPEARAR